MDSSILNFFTWTSYLWLQEPPWRFFIATWLCRLCDFKFDLHFGSNNTIDDGFYFSPEEKLCLIGLYIGSLIRVAKAHFYSQLKIEDITAKIDFAILNQSIGVNLVLIYQGGVEISEILFYSTNLSFRHVKIHHGINKTQGFIHSLPTFNLLTLI